MTDGMQMLYLLHNSKEKAMRTDGAQVELFLQKCDELTDSGYILADTKIGELLRCIAASDVLYAFFRELTRGFDYPAAKRRCLGEGRRLLFPEDAAEKLAFTFCLLADLDNKVIDLPAFLRQYFYEDGSLAGSFYAFSNQVVKPFRVAIRLMFKGAPAPAPQPKPLQEAVAAERDAVMLSPLPDARKVDALLLLNALGACGQDPALLAGALCGYLYFADACGRRGENVEAMRAALAAVKETIGTARRP